MSDDFEGKEVALVAESGLASTLSRSEIDTQISTAKKYPRSITQFRKEALAMVTLNERIAEGCIYAIPRGGKVIEGASARFAEVIASAWGNNRAGARVISDAGEFITAQGVFHDLERNVCITYEVQRRITDSKGKRYNADMIGVTGNAACSIALRNAILKGVPKAFWDDLYEQAKAVVRGDFATLANRRANIFERCQGFDITKEQIFASMGITGEADLTLDHIVHLRGILNAIKDGDTTVELAFSAQEAGAQTQIKQPQRKPPEKPVEAEVVEVTDDKQPAAAAAASSATEDKPLTASQIKMLNAKMEAAALSGADLHTRFGLTLEQLSQANFAAVQAWIASPMGA